MKSPLGWVFALIMFAPLARTSAAEPGSKTEIPVRYSARYAAKDLKIERVTAEPLGEQVRFTIEYASASERYLSFFDPPRGATIKFLERGALKAGGGKAAVVVPTEKLRQVEAITMRFSTSDPADMNFISLDLADPAVRPIFGERGAKVARERSGRGGAVQTVAAADDVRWKDVSAVEGLDREKISSLTFNEATKWAPGPAAISREVLQRGMEPGLGVKSLHRAGITGAGISVGIIDQNMFLDHPEFQGRIARYHDVGCNASRGSMHGPAVASLLVGKNIGTAPGAKVYYVAAPSWTKDVKYEADALLWLLDVNATLAPAEKIRVVSVSAAPSGDGSPFTKNNELWDAACARAEQAGVLVLDCTAHRGVIGAARYDPAAPDDVTRVQSTFTGRNPALRARRVLTPMARRTVAEEYERGQCTYQYDAVGGLSWAIPFAAGVFAMAWQVNPQLTGEQMVELMRQTAFERDGVKYLNPVALVESAKARAKASGGD